MAIWITNPNYGPTPIERGEPAFFTFTVEADEEYDAVTGEVNVYQDPESPMVWGNAYTLFAPPYNFSFRWDSTIEGDYGPLYRARAKKDDKTIEIVYTACSGITVIVHTKPRLDNACTREQCHVAEFLCAISFPGPNCVGSACGPLDLNSSPSGSTSPLDAGGQPFLIDASGNDAFETGPEIPFDFPDVPAPFGSYS